MANTKPNRRYSRLAGAAVAVIGLLGIALPFAPARAEFEGGVNCYDVDPNYHTNLISNPTCAGYSNYGEVNPYYDPQHPYSAAAVGYSQGYYPYYPYRYGR